MEEDTTDWYSFGKKKKKQQASDETKTAVDSSGLSVIEIDMNEDCYKMNHSERGKAVIFNQKRFDTKFADRLGTDKDVDKLKEILTKFRFDVTVHTDKKAGKVFEILQQLSHEDHSQRDCLFIAVLSHGDTGDMIHAKDHAYPAERLWDDFRGDRCPTLAGKPKIFLIQACRGEEVDHGALVKSYKKRSLIESDSVATEPEAQVKESFYKIPNSADILVMYSTFEGYYAWRTESSGSWFVRSIYEALTKYGTERDLLNVLTIANRLLATKYESYTPSTYDWHKKKQIGAVVSTCTRLLYLNCALKK